MKQNKKDLFDIQLDQEEQEIERALPDAWEKLSFSANPKQELQFSFVSCFLPYFG